MVRLRDYQEQALAARAAADPAENRQAIVLPTGTGKTITFGAEAAREPGRTLILTHTDELADQAEDKVRLMAPGRDVGVVKAGRNDVGAEIIIGGVQTLANPDRLGQVESVDRVIVDECHHATASTYRTVLGYCGALDMYEATPVTGYTATLERGDGQSLGKVWHNVAYSRGISWAVRRGHLIQPRGYRVQVPGLTRNQDDAGQDRTIVDGIAPAAVVKAWLEQAAGRSTIVFAPLVASARAMAAAFNDAGITAMVIWGEQAKYERRARIAAYNRGDITVLCNANALTEGFDSPRTSCVIMPPTKSRGRVIQRAGRGLRPWLDGPIPRAEQDCLLLFLGDGAADLNSVADLSDHEGMAARDGQGLTELEDTYNLNDLEPDAPNAYGGPLELVEFDPLVAASSKAWGKTSGGALFLPAGTDRYVAVLPGYAVALVGRHGGGSIVHRGIPDLELAMALGEDAAMEHGGDLGRLLADKTRPWRKGVPTDEAKDRARRMGLGRDLERILASKSSGKAGRLSDLMDKVTASKVIDPVVSRVKERTGQ
jgi:superfamily II DNA or RNA helicase